jgi:nuclear pore complex protein Nup62
MLETHQRGIHDALVGMEGEAERLYREERPLLDDESRWGRTGRLRLVV